MYFVTIVSLAHGDWVDFLTCGVWFPCVGNSYEDKSIQNYHLVCVSTFNYSIKNVGVLVVEPIRWWIENGSLYELRIYYQK